MSNILETQLAEIRELIIQQKLVQKDFLTLNDAAVYIGISKSYLYKLTSTRKIPFYRPETKLIFFKRSELDAWILNNRNAPHEEVVPTQPKLLTNKNKKNGN